MSDSEYSDDEICTECPADLEHMKKKFQAPYMLAQAGIPCLILGTDALALVFWVPTFGSILHIVVAEKFMDTAFGLITQNFGYKIAGHKPAFPTKIMLQQESGYVNCTFLESVSDGVDPSHILIHPETSFNLSVQDYTWSTSVDEFLGAPFHRDVRLPTRKLMVDIIVDTLLHPKASLVVNERGFVQLMRWLLDIVFRTPLRPLVVGELSPEAQTLLASVKEENRPYLETRLRGHECNLDAHREDRRVFMMNRNDATQPASQGRPTIPYSEQYAPPGFPVLPADPLLLH